MAEGLEWDDLIGGAPAADDPFDVVAPGPDDDEPGAEEDASVADVVEDPFASVFAQELENVSASDWDVDADILWGDDGSLDVGADPTAFDFPA